MARILAGIRFQEEPAKLAEWENLLSARGYDFFGSSQFLDFYMKINSEDRVIDAVLQSLLIADQARKMGHSAFAAAVTDQAAEEAASIVRGSISSGLIQPLATLVEVVSKKRRNRLAKQRYIVGRAVMAFVLRELRWPDLQELRTELELDRAIALSEREFIYWSIIDRESRKRRIADSKLSEHLDFYGIRSIITGR